MVSLKNYSQCETSMNYTAKDSPGYRARDPVSKQMKPNKLNIPFTRSQFIGSFVSASHQCYCHPQATCWHLPSGKPGRNDSGHALALVHLHSAFHTIPLKSKDCSGLLQCLMLVKRASKVLNVSYKGIHTTSPMCDLSGLLSALLCCQLYSHLTFTCDILIPFFPDIHMPLYQSPIP